MLLALSAGAQSSTNPPVVFAGAKVCFLHRAGYDAVVSRRDKSSADWKVWQTIPRQTLGGQPVAPIVCLDVPNASAKTEVKVDFKN